MKIDEFRALSEAARVSLVNERLIQLKDNGKTNKEFKSDVLEFSYATAVKEMESLGYGREKNSFDKHLRLSEEEIILLKNLAHSYEFVMNLKEEKPNVKERKDDEIITTSIRMYNKLWKRFQAFSNQWSTLNSTDIMASALEEYLERHDFEDYETLVQQGKIVEKK